MSTTVQDRRMVTVDHPWKTPYGESNGHATDDVTWPQKVMVVTPISLRLYISLTVPDRRLVTTDHL